MTDAERESLQKRLEMLHRIWTKDRDYLPPPTVGKLADIDPAVIVSPPKGLEVGCSPAGMRGGRVCSGTRSTPGPKQKNDVDITWDKRAGK